MPPRSPGSADHAASATGQPGAARQPSEHGGLDLLPALLSIAKSMRQLVGIKLAPHGVVAGQDQLLLCLIDGVPCPMNDLASHLSVRPSTVSKMIDILQRKGWVVRAPDPDDARRVLVRLTGSGEDAAAAVCLVQAELDADLAAALGVDPDMARTLTQLDAVLAKRLSRLR